MQVSESLVQDIVQEVVAKLNMAEPAARSHGVFQDMNEARP